MKKGKVVKLTGLRTAKVLYGTVDSKELKSIYLNLQTWVQPQKESENWDRVILNMTRTIKHSVYNNIDKNYFDEKFIVDLDLRSSGLQINKKSFLNLEINLFFLEPLDFKSTKLKRINKKLIKDIYSDVFLKNTYFKFYLTKNGNKKKEKIQID